MKFWWDTIKELRAANDTLAKSWEKKQSELSILQEAFRNGVRITDELKAEVSSRGVQILQLQSGLSDARAANDDLDQRNRDLEYQNQLLVTVLQTLRIPVKLPARVDKTARK